MRANGGPSKSKRQAVTEKKKHQTVDNQNPKVKCNPEGMSNLYNIPKHYLNLVSKGIHN